MKRLLLLFFTITPVCPKLIVACGLLSMGTGLCSLHASGPYRDWTTKNGAHRVEAQLLRFNRYAVELQRKDGARVEVPLDILSAADQTYLSKRQDKIDHSYAAREWIDATGTFSAIARLVEVKDDQVLLSIIGGKEVKMPLSALREADRVFALNHLEAREDIATPTRNANRPEGPFFQPGQDPRPKKSSWKLVEALSDEFDGQKMDLDKWYIDPAKDGFGWSGRPPAIFKPENVYLEDGKMCVTVSQLKSPEIVGGHRFTHQGAIIRSKNPGHVGLYFECKMKANETEMSSTFWVVSRSSGDLRLELDIQECVGAISDLTAGWAKNWDRIFHSNCIPWGTGVDRVQQGITLEEKNCERFLEYGAWWKSEDEIQFFLAGEHAYTLNPKVKWNLPSYITMAIETYDWNPLPKDGGLVSSASKKARTTQYEWVRTWKLVDGDTLP